MDREVKIHIGIVVLMSMDRACPSLRTNSLSLGWVIQEVGREQDT